MAAPGTARSRASVTLFTRIVPPRGRTRCYRGAELLLFEPVDERLRPRQNAVALEQLLPVGLGHLQRLCDQVGVLGITHRGIRWLDVGGQDRDEQRRETLAQRTERPEILGVEALRNHL